MRLYDYRGKTVKIIDIDGKIFQGYAAYYTSELDDPDGVACLSIEPDHNPDKIFIDFTESEIASIEVIDTDIHEMAKVV